MQATVTIPLTDLVHSKNNSRKNQKADESLMTSIEVHGLQSNLVVVQKDNKYEVIAGGRRLSAIKELHKQKRIDISQGIPCVVLAEGVDPLEASLAENIVRSNLTPVEEFRAFAKMAQQGLDHKEIAKHFSVTERRVLQLMALGNLAPKIISSYENEEIDMETLMAFTVETSHKKQLATLKAFLELPSYIQTGHKLKDMLVGENPISEKSSLAIFIGERAYIDAGGTVKTDLFDDRGNTWADGQTALVVAEDKLQSMTQQAMNDGWENVVRFVPSLDRPNLVYDDLNQNPAEADFPKFYSKIRKVHSFEPNENTKKIEKKINALKEKHGKLKEQLNDENISDEKYDALYDKVGFLFNDIVDLSWRLREAGDYSDKTKKSSACIVCYDKHGKPLFLKGVSLADSNEAHPDSPGINTGHQDESPAEEEKKPVAVNLKDISRPLTESLSNERSEVIRAHLAKDTNLGVDVLYFALAQAYSGKADDTLFSQLSSISPTGRKHANNESSQALRDLKKKLSISKIPASFEKWRALNSKDKKIILTMVGLEFIVPALKGSKYFEFDQSFVEAIAKDLDIDWLNDLKPTAENYFRKLTKVQLLKALKEMNPDKALENKAKSMKNKNLAELLESMTSGKSEHSTDKSKNWIIPSLR